ncbi:MAG: hypothetical protein M1155_00500 [Patescibacteria group bacterium]|nr:hypothetical protein [Patescibacteria group bacterium]
MPGREWVYRHTECDRIFNNKDSMREVVISLKAMCADDAEKEGAEIWKARLKEGEDDHGAKKINGRYFWPSNPRVVLEIKIRT